MAAKRKIPEELEAENAELRSQLADVQAKMHRAMQRGFHYYASTDAIQERPDDTCIPMTGNSGAHCYRMLSDFHEMDCRERLNTSSYVNVFLEEDETKAANLGMKINIADQTVYPSSFRVHNIVLNMIANMWNCPKPADFDEYGAFAGAGTVGSTEACLLGGLCLKFRWRNWYAKKNGLTADQVHAVYPNLVISTCYQAAWEKLFKYMDIEPKFVVPSSKTFTITAEGVKAQVDDKTIGVVCIMGNHYAGQYDPVWDVDAMLTKLNEEKGWQVGIHVDAASGGFVAPFQPDVPAWDFRLPNVLSISASGHKFGESVCGTGWVVWRQREGLSDNVAISVSYLGGKADSYTLNFSRPASGIFVQHYKFNRLGQSGYQHLCDNRMANAKHLRDALKSMKHTDGRPKFRMLDAGDTNCLSVVAACLDPDLKLPYDDIDLQHQCLRYHWYVSGYKMSFHDPRDEETKPLFTDAPASQTMFRVVVKANVTRAMMDNLISSIKASLEEMDALGPGFKTMHGLKKSKTGSKGHAC
eukprot:CAMPEP_0117535612 /NCGR_PEP_ID=MMETSP0784-20121206/41024_1 /TAXON_ID=39447 /ORGANISM="" /LENGTH=526 /DNA_ID=CAMNT_0005332143 /DNA_START=110 /DNA_END=1690 /DNA_ORIENTATION=-